MSRGAIIDVVEPITKPGSCLGLYLHFKESFKSLSTCPREWYINFVSFLKAMDNFSISQILVIYLNKEFGALDVRGGACIWYLGCMYNILGSYDILVER